MKTAKSAPPRNVKRSAMPKSRNHMFTIRRVVNWGDCDPAGFIYTPRVLDFACEAIDAWLREVLEVSWWQLKSSGLELGLPTVNAVCDYISILRPDQSVALNVFIREVGRSSVVFEVEGVAAGDRLAFRVKMVSCATDMAKLRATRLPDWMRKKFEAYRRSRA